jgi:hypothetical protein
MNFEKVVFAFFVLLAAALNDADNYLHHPAYELFAALVVNLIATVLKLGDRTHLGAVLLATSLVADLLLIGAAATWGYYSQVLGDAASPEAIIAVVSPAAGALFANVASVVLLVAETINLRR